MTRASTTAGNSVGHHSCAHTGCRKPGSRLLRRPIGAPLPALYIRPCHLSFSTVSTKRGDAICSTATPQTLLFVRGGAGTALSVRRRHEAAGRRAAVGAARASAPAAGLAHRRARATLPVRGRDVPTRDRAPIGASTLSLAHVLLPSLRRTTPPLTLRRTNDSNVSDVRQFQP